MWSEWRAAGDRCDHLQHGCDRRRPAHLHRQQREKPGWPLIRKFASNGYVYLFYTARNGSGCATGITYGTANGFTTQTGRAVNRVSRFVLGGNDLINPAAETIIVNNMPSPGGNHNAGDLHFGKDGYLYISIGDGGTDYAGDSGSGGGNDARATSTC